MAADFARDKEKGITLSGKHPMASQITTKHQITSSTFQTSHAPRFDLRV